MASAIYANITRESADYFRLLRSFHSNSQSFFEESASGIQEVTRNLHHAQRLNQEAQAAHLLALHDELAAFLKEQSAALAHKLELTVRSVRFFALSLADESLK